MAAAVQLPCLLPFRAAAALHVLQASNMRQQEAEKELAVRAEVAQESRKILQQMEAEYQARHMCSLLQHHSLGFCAHLQDIMQMPAPKGGLVNQAYLH